jgi:hypothetical protein
VSSPSGKSRNLKLNNLNTRSLKEDLKAGRENAESRMARSKQDPTAKRREP